MHEVVGYRVKTKQLKASYDLVTVVWPEELPKLLGTRNKTVRLRWLREQQRAGRLITPYRGILQAQARIPGRGRGYSNSRRAYVFNCPAAEIPWPQRRRARVLAWQ